MSVNNSQQSDSNETTADQYSITARYYDRLYTGKAPDDLAFYLEQAGRSGGSILELGCGTGRITLPLAREGFQVTGLDNSIAMLEQLELKLAGVDAETQNRVKLVQGDMADFNAGTGFSLVIAPFRAFQHLLNVEAQKSCLGCIRHCLAGNGRFIFNAFEPNIEYMLEMGSRDDWTVDVEAVTADKSELIRRAFKVRHDKPAQIIRVDWRLEICAEDGTVQETHIEQMELRWFYRYEAQHLLELAGFRIVEALSDYDGTKLGNNCKELIYVCEAVCN